MPYQTLDNRCWAPCVAFAVEALQGRRVGVPDVIAAATAGAAVCADLADAMEAMGLEAVDDAVELEAGINDGVVRAVLDSCTRRDAVIILRLSRKDRVHFVAAVGVVAGDARDPTPRVLIKDPCGILSHDATGKRIEVVDGVKQLTPRAKMYDGYRITAWGAFRRAS